MRALVVGATGFIGAHVVDALLAAGHEVRATRRRRSITLALRGKPIELVPGSLEEPAALRAAMTGCDVVLFCAAHYPRYSLDVEAAVRTARDGTRALAEAALDAGVRRVVATGTIATLATAPPGRIADERDLEPAPPSGSAYRTAKWWVEAELDSARARGLDVVSLLPGACIGANDLRLGTSGLLAAVLLGELPWWVEGWVNCVDVRDVARAHVVAAEGARTAPHVALPGHSLRFSALLHFLHERYGAPLPSLELGPEEARARADRDERAAAAERRRVPWPRELVDVVAGGQPVSGERARRSLGVERRPLEETFDRAHAWLTTSVIGPLRARAERRTA